MMLHAKQFDFLRPTKKDEKLKSYSQRDCGKDENNLTSDRVKKLYNEFNLLFRKSCYTAYIQKTFLLHY